MSEEREESARTCREAAEAYLGGRKVEAAGVFERSPQVLEGELGDWPGWLFERFTKGRAGRLRGSFLLAVTKDKVHAFKHSGRSHDLRVKSEIAVFDRDEIRLRRTPGGEVIWLLATESGRISEIDLSGEVVEEDRGAAEVLAALRE